MPHVYIESYGCSLNMSEGEVMAGLLTQSEHHIVKSPEESDILIVNMCSVKTPTETKIIKRVKELSTLQKPMIVAGCLPVKGEKTLIAISSSISLVNTQNLHRIVEAVDSALSGNHVEYLTKEKQSKLGLPKVRKNSVVSIVPISSGCDLACTYCNTTAIKGPLLSYPARDIRAEVRKGLKTGAKEFWITSQDNGAYYTERMGKSMLPSLLNGISALRGDFRVRVGMMNPGYIRDILDELLDSFEDDSMFKFFHIPVQAGSDRVLQLMKRDYTVEEFKDIVHKLRKRFPESSISTDIICGFPGETEEEFEESLSLLQRIEPDVLNISRFWSREGTVAARMESKLHGNITKERSQAATKLFKRISEQRCAQWLGWEGIALVDEIGKKRGTMMARNNAYRPIVVKGNADLLGRFISIKVTETGPHYLLGEEI